MPNINLNSLQTRLYLALLISFIIIGAATSCIFIHSSQAHQHHVTQIMHQELGKHVADHYTFSVKGENGQHQLDYKKIKHAFHELMILGPNFEFYVLDNNGNIEAYSADKNVIKLDNVNLTAITEFLQIRSLEKSVYGPDPRSLNGTKVFSAAPIHKDGSQLGYIYVILGSQIYDSIVDGNIANYTLKWGLAVLAIGFLISLLVMLWLTGFIVKPLKKLTHQIRQVSNRGFSQKELEQGHLMEALSNWDNHNQNDIHLLGSSFKLALEKLSEQYKKVVSVDELRQELLSHISHDLRTPLASMLGYLETWEINQDKLSPEESAKYIHTAKYNAKKISSLIEQLFELAYLDSGNVQIRKERFSIAELIQDVLSKFQIAAVEKNIKLDVTPKDASITVLGDIEKLDRVFTNLLENALRHTPDNGSITVRLTADSRFVAVEVSDTGIGIPDTDLPHIFDPHFKAGNSVRENTAHGGLGLAITKKLLGLHQSQIQVKSQMNKGTTFSFNLAV